MVSHDPMKINCQTYFWKAFITDQEIRVSAEDYFMHGSKIGFESRCAYTGEFSAGDLRSPFYFKIPKVDSSYRLFIWKMK